MTAKLKRHHHEHLTTFGANLKQLYLERAVARTHNIRLKEIIKRMALFGNQTLVLISTYFDFAQRDSLNTSLIPFFLKFRQSRFQHQQLHGGSVNLKHLEF